MIRPRALLSGAVVWMIVATAVRGQKPDPKPEGTGSALSDTEAAEFLDYHNTARKEVGVESVKWSKDLAAFAQTWADRLAEGGELEHRPATGEWAQKYGENIAVHSTALKGAEAWYGEKKDYTAGTSIPEDFSQFKAGHYTQMVWKGTTHVGAGRAVVKQGRFKGLVIVVCNYDPAGNVIGEKPY